MSNLNPDLSKTSPLLGAILDKAMCEKEFRWELLANQDELIKKYHISDTKDIEELVMLKNKNNQFFLNILSEYNASIDEVGEGPRYKRSRPELDYEEALQIIRGDDREDDKWKKRLSREC